MISFRRAAGSLLAVLAGCGLPAGAQAGGPENVAVVINDASPLSRSIGEYYARRRAIPPGQICRVRSQEAEEVPRDVFEAAIARPIARWLRAHNLTEQILYIVTTAGLPLRVRGTAGMDGDAAAVDSELTLLYAELHGVRHPIKGAAPNPFFARRTESFSHPQFPVYLVTRLAAYDFAGARALVDRAIEAGNPKYRGKGKIVIDLKEGDTSPGNEWLRDASLRVPQDRLVFDDSAKVVYDQTGVIAYASWGSNDSARKKRKPGFQWLPGAIMTEFVSTNGRTFQKPPDTWTLGTWADRSSWFAGAPQTLTADYIEEGVTGASGHVEEPFLSFTPRPEILISAYLSGRNLAESYYLAMPGLSWQNIVIGDPLCRLP